MLFRYFLWVCVLVCARRDDIPKCVENRKERKKIQSHIDVCKQNETREPSHTQNMTEKLKVVYEQPGAALDLLLLLLRLFVLYCIVVCIWRRVWSDDLRLENHFYLLQIYLQLSLSKSI